TGGDGFTNTVEFHATTTPIDPTDETGVWGAWDDSHAGLSAPVATLSNQVLARGAPSASTVCSGVAAGSANWLAGDDDEPAGDFRLGDTICYVLTVEFPDGVDTRNPAVADVVPAGIEVAGWTAGAGSPPVGTPSTEGQSITWL